MSATRKGWGRLIDTPYGQARVNDKGLVMWAEWEVWRHAAELVEEGLWRSQPSASRTRQRTEFYALEVHAIAEERPGYHAKKTTDAASSAGLTES
ncbi:MAG: hypothetical protein M3357_11905 [Actinomycetota bacterium]|nr:hypothetical protein [Actinomycetota bacterium]